MNKLREIRKKRDIIYLVIAIFFLISGCLQSYIIIFEIGTSNLYYNKSLFIGISQVFIICVIVLFLYLKKLTSLFEKLEDEYEKQKKI